MPNSFHINQPLAAELGLPQARNASPATSYPVQLLMDYQEQYMRRKAERERKRKPASFLPPVFPMQFGVARKEDGDE